MGWFSLKRGEWTTGAPDDRLDPYLLWADTTNFADFRLEQTRSDKLLRSFTTDKDLVPVLIKLRCPLPKSLFEKISTPRRSLRLEPMVKALREATLAANYIRGSRFLTLAVNYKFMRLLTQYPLLHRWIEKESVKQFRIIRGKLRIPLCINDSSVDEVDYAK